MGREPYKHLGTISNFVLMSKVVGGERPPIDDKWPEPIRKVLARCWGKDPATRPNFAEIAMLLREFERGHIQMDAIAVDVDTDADSDANADINAESGNSKLASLPAEMEMEKSGDKFASLPVDTAGEMERSGKFSSAPY